MQGGAAPQPEGEYTWSSLDTNQRELYLRSAAEVVRLSEVALDAQAHAIGAWHGTSLEAIEHALRLGAIAPSAVAHGAAEAGHLFFYPANSIDFDPQLDLELQFHGRGGALQYAYGSAGYHYFIKQCGLDFTNPEHHILVMEALDCVQSSPRASYTRDALTELGVDEDQQKEFIRSVKNRKGFLLAISRTALEEFKPTPGDQPGIDEKIFVPAGLPFSYISAIQPLGAVERAFIEQLREILAQGKRTPDAA